MLKTASNNFRTDHPDVMFCTLYSIFKSLLHNMACSNLISKHTISFSALSSLISWFLDCNCCCCCSMSSSCSSRICRMQLVCATPWFGPLRTFLLLPSGQGSGEGSGNPPRSSPKPTAPRTLSASRGCLLPFDATGSILPILLLACPNSDLLFTGIPSPPICLQGGVRAPKLPKSPMCPSPKPGDCPDLHANVRLGPRALLRRTGPLVCCKVSIKLGRVWMKWQVSSSWPAKKSSTAALVRPRFSAPASRWRPPLVNRVDLIVRSKRRLSTLAGLNRQAENHWMSANPLRGPLPFL